jgi:GT2 family glycosyltransferase
MSRVRPDLTISIVNTDNRAMLVRCLRVLEQPAPKLALELFVVDNASTDGSAELLGREFPHVRVLENSERLGFAASHNRALAQGTGRYLIILNDDTAVLPGCFETMVRFMDAHPDAGACGAQLLNPDGSLQRTANRFPTLLFGIFEALALNRLLPNNPIWRHNIYADWDRTTAREVDAVSGAALLIRQEALAQIGLLDPNFFIYSEEIDWCYRLHQRGWKVYYLPEARITHFGGQSTAARAPQKFHDIYWESFLYYYKKHYGAPIYFLLRALYGTRMTARRLLKPELQNPGIELS